MGSGVNGAAVGEGIVVDFTRHMRSVLEVASDGSWVRVQPGLVMATLNQQLHPQGVFFPPDPSSGNHCSLGGMIGTNASGARSVAYGATKDRVLALEVVMTDGAPHNTGPITSDRSGLAALRSSRDRADEAFWAVLQDLAGHREDIATGMPRVKKNSCGYRIETLLDQLPPIDLLHELSTSDGAASDRPGSSDPSQVIPLQRLFVGAEGTLGLVTEATLSLAPLPGATGIAMAYFPSLSAAGEAVSSILELGPTALDIMDSQFLGLVRRYDSRVDAMLPGDADTALLIEFEGQHDEALDAKFADLEAGLADHSSSHLVRAQGQADTEFLWHIRKSAVALMQKAPGRRQPLPFIEDIAVPPERLPECIAYLQRLFDQHDIQAVAVGHVGDGNLHVRPMLDPRDPADLLMVQRLYDEISGYVIGAGGTLSGEHGDGLVHTGRLQEIYGAEIYGVFSRIKKVFDPVGVFNPGKKVGPQGEGGPLANARYGPDYSTLPQQPLLRFPARGYETETERCHGCAVCKSTVTTTMCPTYKVTHREHASPRAKANLLRAVISGELDAKTVYDNPVTKQVLGYCIGCGMCAAECPSGVNIPKLVLEAKSRYRLHHRASPVEFVLSHAESMARTASRLAPLANRALAIAPIRRLAESLLGMDRRRPLGPFARRAFRSNIPTGTLAKAGPPSVSARGNAQVLGTGPMVAYFCDLFADYYDPSLAQSAVDVLTAHGATVVVPQQRSSGIPEMLYGYAARAREIAAANVGGVLAHVKRGAYVVSAEPTATFAFKVHYPDYLGSEDCSLVANAARDLGELVLSLRDERPRSAPTPAALDPTVVGRLIGSAVTLQRPLRVGYHQPCHLKTLGIGDPALELLSQIPLIEVTSLSAGCCGMAGTFGMRRDTYDLSLAAGRPLFERVEELAPDLLVSECSTCRMQLSHATGLPTIHPVKLLAASYGVGEINPSL